MNGILFLIGLSLLPALILCGEEETKTKTNEVEEIEKKMTMMEVPLPEPGAPKFVPADMDVKDMSGDGTTKKGKNGKDLETASSVLYLHDPYHHYHHHHHPYFHHYPYYHHYHHHHHPYHHHHHPYHHYHHHK